MIKIDYNIGYVLLDTLKINYVAVSDSSGGYPYYVNGIWDAKIFHNKSKAEEYSKMFAKENWSIHAVGII